MAQENTIINSQIMFALPKNYYEVLQNCLKNFLIELKKLDEGILSFSNFVKESDQKTLLDFLQDFRNFCSMIELSSKKFYSYNDTKINFVIDSANIILPRIYEQSMKFNIASCENSDAAYVFLDSLKKCLLCFKNLILCAKISKPVTKTDEYAYLDQLILQLDQHLNVEDQKNCKWGQGSYSYSFFAVAAASVALTVFEAARSLISPK